MSKWQNKFLNVINDDLNMPEAMAVLWDMLKDENLDFNNKLYLAYDFDRIFGLELDKVKEETNVAEIPEEIILLSEQRTEAKRNKDYKLSDEIREIIKEKGYDILDKKDGVEIKKIS